MALYVNSDEPLALYRYGFYYDVICKGQYVWKVEEMHRKYVRSTAIG
jgi:hypothetical protein